MDTENSIDGFYSVRYVRFARFTGWKNSSDARPCYGLQKLNARFIVSDVWDFCPFFMGKKTLQLRACAFGWGNSSGVPPGRFTSFFIGYKNSSNRQPSRPRRGNKTLRLRVLTPIKPFPSPAGVVTVKKPSASPARV